MSKKVYIPGVWDLFHVGHLNALREAKKYGDHLVVGVCSDELCELTKGSPIINEKSRLSIIKSLRIVDHAIVYRTMDYFSLIEEFDINTFAVGAEFGYLPEHKIALGLCMKNDIEIKYIPRLDSISSTIIKAKIKDDEHRS